MAARGVLVRGVSSLSLSPLLFFFLFCSLYIFVTDICLVMWDEISRGAVDLLRGGGGVLRLWSVVYVPEFQLGGEGCGGTESIFWVLPPAVTHFLSVDLFSGFSGGGECRLRRAPPPRLPVVYPKSYLFVVEGSDQLSCYCGLASRRG